MQKEKDDPAGWTAGGGLPGSWKAAVQEQTWSQKHLASRRCFTNHSNSCNYDFCVKIQILRLQTWKIFLCFLSHQEFHQTAHWREVPFLPLLQSLRQQTSWKANLVPFCPVHVLLSEAHFADSKHKSKASMLQGRPQGTLRSDLES